MASQWKDMTEEQRNEKRAKVREYHRKRWAEDPEWRESRKQKNKNRYHAMTAGDREAVNAKARENHAKRMTNLEYADARHQKYLAVKGTPEFEEAKRRRYEAWYERNRERLSEEQKKMIARSKTDKALADTLYRRNRNAALKREYGITLVEYEQMHAAQDGKCAICGNPEKLRMKHCDRAHGLAVDHDHETGEVRGLLCSDCNFSIGHMKDDPERLIAAAAYLRRNGK